MNSLTTLLILLMAILVVFWEAAFNPIRSWLGAQVELLPALMVYTALRHSLTAVALLAVVGGLCFDSLSANPLGISVLPLFLVGLLLLLKRDLILHQQPFAQMVLGFAASALAPVLTLLILLTGGTTPLLGWGSLWQLLVVAAGGALAAPVFFELFGWFDRTLVYGPAHQTTFRPDREIRRGRL
ncbi:MAG TPA: rod shape-determining protein MreD [Verrucomicrobiota bacterium]|nr:rod shape-determining protein MreD [Verrucomicrobiota bacterium]HRT07523.1 rod shape-determining protein MreD [Candidatus Paceibacterota bacterium]HRT57221.1 rod shape-determining protein MreD [Candidatus Paceibacterota bacterium]